MNTIVMNTLTGAVTEYTNFDFQSITPTHAASVLGLYLFGGDRDVAAKIVSEVVTPKSLWGSSAKKQLGVVFLSLKGTGSGNFDVYGQAVSYSYVFAVRSSGESRCPLGRGVRENYLAFGYRNTDGKYFQLDGFEVSLGQSKSRRASA